MKFADRVPVVVRPEDFSRWLNGRDHSPGDVGDLLVGPTPGSLEPVPLGASERLAREPPGPQER